MPNIVSCFGRNRVGRESVNPPNFEREYGRDMENREEIYGGLQIMNS